MHHGIISNLAGLGAAMLLLVQPAWAQRAPPQTVRAAVLRVDVPALPPISRLDAPPVDLGFAGARLAIQDNDTTGRFMGQDFEALEIVAGPDTAAAEMQKLLDQGIPFIVTLADADQTLALADQAGDRALILNAKARGDRLRNEGVPIEDETYNGNVISQKFSGGELSYDSSTKTFSSVPPDLASNLTGVDVPIDATAAINQAWRAAGGISGPLGARQGAQTTVGDNGAAQGYAGGKIFYSPATGAHAVTGAILSKYESAGGPTGDLGFPNAAEADGGAPNSRVSTFSAPDKPVIFWTPDTGAVAVRGAINAAWDKLGGATGKLGVPTGEQSVDGDTVTQKFANGEISWDKASGAFSTKPADLASSLSGVEVPAGGPHGPGTASGKSGKALTWHWWWLLVIIPILLLIALNTLLHCLPLFAVALFAVQLLLSRVWLRHFRFGPMEWLWRAITYWRLPPLRRDPADARPR